MFHQPFVGDQRQVDTHQRGKFGDDDVDIKATTDSERVGDAGVQSVDSSKHSHGQGWKQIAAGNRQDLFATEFHFEIDLAQ